MTKIDTMQTLVKTKAILILTKVGIRGKNITVYKEVYFIFIKGVLVKKERKILNNFVLKKIISQYIKQKLTMKIHNCQRFQYPSLDDRKNRHKLSNNVENWNNTISQLSHLKFIDHFIQ